MLRLMRLPVAWVLHLGFKGNIMTDISIFQIPVNYSLLVEQLAYPVQESVGTLIHARDGKYYVKISDTHCREASDDEVSNWEGPVAPWFHNPS